MRLLSVVGGLLALLGGGAGAAAQAPAARTFTNPRQVSGPDPWVIRHGGYSYYTNTTGQNLTLWKSKTLAGVKTAPAAVVWAPPAADGRCEGRSARAQRFTRRPDGTPDFGVPAALATPQPVPSGE